MQEKQSETHAKTDTNSKVGVLATTFCVRARATRGLCHASRGYPEGEIEEAPTSSGEIGET